jgi:hypothetical protein
MLPIAAAFGSTSPSGVLDGLTVRHAVRTFPCSSALRWVRPPATLLCSFALRLVSPTTMASADFSTARAGEISPGKGTMLPRATTAFTSTGKPDDFAVLCQLVVPCRSSMRFLSIGSRVSPSLPSRGRSPFRAWLQMVVSFIFMFWFSYRGLAPHLHRAHAGHTQGGSGNGGQRPSFASLCESSSRRATPSTLQ